MKWAVFDTSWLVYRARYGIGPLSFAGAGTEIVYGVLEQLRAVCAEPRVNTNAAALCFDDRASLRRAALPGYKAARAVNRTAEEEEARLVLADQVRRLRTDVLIPAGFVCWQQPGLESDDVMAQAALQLTNGSWRGEGVLVTADNDLYQCISDRVHWYDPARNLYLDPAAAHYKLGIPPAEWGRVKCIAGCAGDSVPGVPNVGPKTATDYLLGLLKRGARYEAITGSAGQETARRNRPLVLLPHPATRPVDLRPPAYKPAAFYAAAARLGFASFLDGSRRRAWDAFFAGGTNPSRQRPRKRQESAL